MDNSAVIVIAADFSETPFGRYKSDGHESGEEFRERLLLPKLFAGQRVVLNIDGVAGLPSSFWEEALGGAVRRGIPPERMRELLTIDATQPDLQTYVRLGWRYIAEADQKKRGH